MRIPAVLAALLFLVLSPLAHANEDLLAPAKEGKLWCYEPNLESKTCRSFSRFTWDAQGNVWEQDELAISANPLVTMKVNDSTAVEGSILCQVLREEVFRNASFLVNGAPASTDEDKMYREGYGARFVQFYGKKFCLDISPYESVYIVQVSIDGTPYPSATSRMKWISPDEGYALAP